VRLWVEDLTFYLGRVLRVVGVAMAVVAWASVLGSEAQASADLRTAAIVLSAIGAVLIVHLFFVGLPPSSRLVEVVRSLERDLVAAAREVAGRDAERLQDVVARMAALASVRISRSGNVPRDRRAWLTLLARLAAQD